MQKSLCLATPTTTCIKKTSICEEITIQFLSFSYRNRIPCNSLDFSVQPHRSRRYIPAAASGNKGSHILLAASDTVDDPDEGLSLF